LIKLLSLFSGIGAFEKALQRQGINYKLINYSEVDKFASKAYCAIHDVDEDKNLWDIKKIDSSKLPDFDLMTYGFPCQSVSIAGRREGFSRDNETESSLLWNAMQLVETKKPKWLVAENVKNLVGKKFYKDFQEWLKYLNKLGYNNYWKVLNAKDFGVPQNRERVFIISIRKDIDNNNFKFPIGFESNMKLKDLLEDEVEDKYYIDLEKVVKLLKDLKSIKTPTISKTVRASDHSSFDKHSWDIYTADKKIIIDDTYGFDTTRLYEQKSPTLRSSRFGLKVLDIKNDETFVLPCLTPERINKRQQGRRFKNNEEPAFTVNTQDRHGVLINRGVLKIRGDNNSTCLDANYYKGLDNHGARTGIIQIGLLDIKGNKQVRRIYLDKGLSPTLNSMQGGNRQPKVLIVKENDEYYLVAIRKLTPLECWRLMDFDDNDFYRAKNAGISNSQLYKMAGNSIVVGVLEEIFKKLFLNKY